MPIRLLALDLDGTLLRPRGGIDPRDVDAVHRAVEAGITVTIATGRIATGALETARALGMRAPIVCAEGALIVDPAHGAVIERQVLPAHAVESLLATLDAHDLRPFWFTHDEVHGEEAGAAHLDYVNAWSPRVTLHATLRGSTVWARRDEVAMAIGVGDRAAVEAAHARVTEDQAGTLTALAFPVFRADAWTLLARNAAVDKAVGLARVAALLGIDRAEVAVVGDWLNDVPMFRWAARSFVMGQAPPEVAVHATDRLAATHRTGGGVAEAIAKLLG